MSLVYATSEQVGLSLEAALNGIVGVNHPTVDRQYHENFENYVLPAAFVNDESRDIVRVLKDVIKVVHHFDIIVFNKSTMEAEGGDLATLINSLIDDVSEALIKDPTRGGVAHNTVITRVITDEGAYEPLYVAALSIEVHYLARK